MNVERERFNVKKRLSKAPDLAKTSEWDFLKNFVHEMTVEIAETWGRLMQAELEKGTQEAPVTIASVAEPTARQVIRYFRLEGGLENVPFLNARTLLVNGWKYGPALRTWPSNEFGV